MHKTKHTEEARKSLHESLQNKAPKASMTLLMKTSMKAQGRVPRGAWKSKLRSVQGKAPRDS
eukprot:1162137-Pelagomonas_calceolata.AAC.8